MRLVTFAASGAQRIGALVDGDRRIVDFAAAPGAADPAFSSMQALIEVGEPALNRAREIVAAAQTERPRNDRYRVGQATGAVAGAGANA